MSRFPWQAMAFPLWLLACTTARGQVVPHQKPLVRGAASGSVIQKLNGEMAQILAQVSPAVVQIRVVGFGLSESGNRTEAAVVERQRSLGSGIIVDPSGYILTNEHVIHGAQRVSVLLPAIPGSSPSATDSTHRRIFEAKVIGSQPDVDLALLKIEATGLPVLSLEKVRPAKQGELVFAIGSPNGLDSSVTMGVVSAAERQVENAYPMAFIQTDAPINPGNSGGPLVDAEGTLLGINAFILTRSGGSEGLGFAIPAETVKFVYDSLRKYGRVRRIEVGILSQGITPELAAGLQLPRDWGVVVSDVDPDGAAKAAGVEPGDIIDAIDGQPIYSLAGLMREVFVHPIDKLVNLKLLHGDETYTLEIMAKESSRPTDRLGELAVSGQGLVRRLGIIGVDIDDQIRSMMPHLRSGPGVVVGARIQEATSADSGLQAGDVIRALNQTRIDSLETLKKAVRALKAGEAVALQVEREGKLSYLSFEME
jgi:serine protease Do